MILFTQNVQRPPQKCILNGMEMTSNKTKKTGTQSPSQSNISCYPVSLTSVVMLNIYWWNGISNRNWMTKKHKHTTLETGKLVSSSKVELKVVEMEYLLQNNSSRRTDKKNTPKTTRERRRWRTKREQKKINAKNVTRKSHF